LLVIFMVWISLSICNSIVFIRLLVRFITYVVYTTQVIYASYIYGDNF